MPEEEETRLERIKQASEKWTAESSRAVAAADANALLRALKELMSVWEETEKVTRELSSDQLSDQAGFMEELAEDMRRMNAAWGVARTGEVIATAEFDPGIAPFTIEARTVPVPVTSSKHFIISLYRGQYVVTSFRYFWLGYTPERVAISWPCINRFTVTFDDKYEATCDWSWGAGATWSMTVPEGSQKPGLSPYFFTPRKPPPPGCQDIPLE